MKTNLIQACPVYLHRIRQCLTLGLLAALGSSSFAATLTWTTGDGGSGLWSDTDNWGGSTFASGDSAIFGSTLGTTTLTNDLATTTRVASFTFNADAPAYTMGGAAFAPASGGTSFIVNSAGNITQTINNNFTLHQNSVDVTGSGNLTLGGSITKGGTWNPFLQMNGTGVLTLNGAGSMNIGGSTNAYQFNSGTVVLAKSVAGAFNPAGVTINGSTVKLAAADQLKSGALTLNAGILDLNGFDSQTSASPGSLAAAPSLNGVGGLITNNTAGTGTNFLVIGSATSTSVYGGTINDGATAKVGVTVNDNGPNQNLLILSGRNNYSGGTTIKSQSTADRAATLSIADVANIGSSGNRSLTFIGNSAAAETVLQLTGTAVTNSNQFDALTFTSGKGVSFDVADTNNTFTLGQNAAGGNITMGGAGILQKRGAGTLVIAGNLSYTGATNLLGGTLKIDVQSGGALASTSALGLGGGDLYLLGKATGITTQTLGAVTMGLRNFNFAGVGASKITVDASTGSGTTLSLGSLANSTQNGSTLNIKVGSNAMVTTTTISVTNNLLGNGRVVFTDASNVVEFANISATGGATRTIQAATYTVGLPTSGSTTLNYSQSDNASVTGDATVNALKLTTTTTGQALTIDPGQTLALTSGGLLFTGANDYSISGGTLKSNTATDSDLIIHHYGAGNLTIGSVIANGAGASTLTKAGTGTLVLSGANTYSGLTLVNGGTLSISSDSNIGGTNGTFANLTSATNSASVTYTGSLPTGFGVGSTMLGRTVTAINTGTSTITLSGNANTALSGGTASWAFVGIGTSGNASFNYGSSHLWLNSGGVLQATSSFSLQQSNAGGTAGTTTANRAVTIGTGGGGFDVTGANTLTIPGNISASGMITKSGTGTLVLGGSNGITGGLTINDGTVQLANASALGSVATSNLIFGSGSTAKLQLNNNDAKVTSLVSSNTNAIVENGSATAGTKTLTVYNGADNTYAGKLQNGGTGLLALAKTGGGTLTLTGTNTYTGPTTISNGTLSVGTIGNGGVAGNLGQATATATNIVFAGGTLQYTGANATSNRAFTINAGTTATIDTANNLSFAGATGTATTGALTKTGAGMLTLTGTNTYTGATSVTGGILRINGSTSAGSAGSAVGVSAGALGGTGTVNGAVTLSNTGGINLGDGAVATLTLGSTLTITGGAGANNLSFDLASAGSTTDKIAATGAFSMTNIGAGVVNLNQIGGVATRLTAGSYDLITAASGFTAGGGDFTLATTKAFGQTFSLADTTTTALKLTTTQVTATTPAAFWSGTTDNNWSTVTNWKTTVAGGIAAGAAPDYQTNVTFSTTTPAPGNLTTNVLDTDFDINSLTFNDTAGGATIGGTKMLTIEATNANSNTAGNGITSNNTSGTNTVSAKVGLAASQTWTVAGGGTLAVSGTISDFGGGYGLTKAGAGTLILTGANTNTGNTTVTDGTLQVGSSGAGSTHASSAVSVNGSTAVLAGTGTVYGATTVTLGQIRPGDTGGSGIGTLSTGNVTLTGAGSAQTRLTLQTSATGASSLNDAAGISAAQANNALAAYLTGQAANYEAEAGSHDKLNITGSLNLNANGRIAFDNAAAYSFAFGDIFDLIDWTGMMNLDGDGVGGSATFDVNNDLELPGLSSGLVFDRSLFASNGIVVVVPEPSRMLLLGAGIIGLLLRRRRTFLSR